ncbi:MAG: type II toxin-antitoxin system antitoxin DNA ADP-ribosyl glycohydrolase DarG [Rhodanobacteraceae bacterium]
MIDYTTGDILNADAEALVNTVNCVGIMGRGIALQFKNTFPKNFAAYVDACKREEVQPGRMFLYETGFLANPKYIVNFPTKRHWRGKSRIEDIETGLRAVVEEIQERGIRSIAVPPLGSGLGGLEWSDVRARIDAALGGLDDVRVIVFEPNGKPDIGKAFKPKAVPKMTAGRAALVVLMNRYLSGLLDPFVSLLEVHKLLYFMQEAGQPLRLRYKKATYGPYAENLRHVLHDIEGYMISGYRGEDSPHTQLALVPGAVDDAEAFLQDNSTTRQHFTRVAGLVEGFESPFGLELLATAHWVMTREHAASVDDVITRTYAWGERKRAFTPRQIGLAAGTLRDRGWLDESHSLRREA